MSISSCIRVAAVALAAVAGVPFLASAQAGDPDPRAILKEAAAALAAHNSFQLVATVAYKGKFQGSEEQIDTDYTIAVQRPDRLALHLESADQEMSVYADGKEFTTYIPHYKQYRVIDQTMTTQDILTGAGSELNTPALLAIGSLITAEPFSGPFGTEALSYVGKEQVNGQSCDHVRFAAYGRVYNLWIEEAPTRLVRRIEPDMAPEEAQYTARFGIPFDFEVVVNLDKWDLTSDVSQTLTFTPPDGVEKVAMFMPPAQTYPAEALKGTPAPDFTLPLLAGGELTLSKEKGSIVILDFWASWCIPCRVGLPVIKQIATEYEGKGVKVFTVNQGDDADTIKAFVTQFNLEGLPVALDTDASINNLYMAEVIPLTIIIGKDGVVQIVHIGTPIDREAMANVNSQEEADKIAREMYIKSLRTELDALLAEKAPGAN